MKCSVGTEVVISLLKMSEFVIIEQDGDGGAYITHLDNLDEYQSIGDGVYLYMKEQDFCNMCQAGVGG